MSDRHPKSLVGLRYFDFDTYYVEEFKLRTTQQELLRLIDAIHEEEGPYDVIAYRPCGKLIAITLRGGVTLYVKRKKVNIILADIAILKGRYNKVFHLGGGIREPILVHLRTLCLYSANARTTFKKGCENEDKITAWFAVLQQGEA
jgi:hypothetical protein